MHTNSEAYTRLAKESEKDLLIGLVIGQEVTDVKLDALKKDFDIHLSHHWKAAMVVISVALTGAVALIDMICAHRP